MKIIKLFVIALVALFLANTLQTAKAQSVEIESITNSVAILNWITPDPSAHPGAVHVYIKNNGRSNATKFKVKLVLWEYADGRIGLPHTYSKTVTLLKPNYTTWVSLSGFRWPNGNEYDGYIQVGTNYQNIRF